MNGEGKIVWDHNNYSPGDEEELYEKLTGNEENCFFPFYRNFNLFLFSK